MERKAHYALIGLFTFAVVAGAFGFIFWLHHSSGKKQAVAYRVIFDSSVSGLQVGGNVLFNGIRVGEVTNLRLDPDKPNQVVAMLAVNKSTPIRSDTRVGLEFAGLTGVAAVSLKGVSSKTPLIEREEGEPPTLKADPSASQDMAVRKGCAASKPPPFFPLFHLQRLLDFATWVECLPLYKTSCAPSNL